MYDAESRQALFARRQAAEIIERRHSRLPTPTRTENCMLRQINWGYRSIMLPSGDMFVTASYNESVAVFDLTPEPVLRHVLPAGDVGCWNVACIGDDLIVAVNSNGGITTWCPSSGESRGYYELGFFRSDAIVACEGGIIVLSDDNGIFVLLKHSQNGARITRICKFRVNQSDCPYQTLVAHDSYFAGSSADSVTVWDAAKKQGVARLPLTKSDAGHGSFVDLNRRYLVAVRGDSMHVYSRERRFTLRRVVRFPRTNATAVKILANDKALIAGVGGSYLALVCLKTGELLQRSQSPFSQVNDIDVTADGRLVVMSYDINDSVAIFDPPRGSKMHCELIRHARNRYGKKFVPRDSVVRWNKSKAILKVAGTLTIVFSIFKLFKKVA